MRTGLGFDTHRLETGRPFRLGGIDIPFTKGAAGHSDADVLIHALCDALLGAAALRDIGFHFPDASPEFKGIDSRILLTKTHDLLNSNGYSIVNIDTTVVLQEPKISPFIPDIVNSLASVLGIDPSLISVKAKTSEGLGFIGRGEGVSAYAIVLIEKA
jgi:2-C-methyl-D-erythritol 2,4-cyclodiphosphate synthase